MGSKTQAVAPHAPSSRAGKPVDDAAARFMNKHPFEVWIGGEFNSRFSNLACAQMSAQERRGYVIHDGERIEATEYRTFGEFLSRA